MDSVNPVLEVVISPAGEVTLSVSGVPGPTCTTLTQAIEQALGRVTADRQTPDYHRQARQRHEQGR